MKNTYNAHTSHKGKNKDTQLSLVYYAFYSEPKTMKEVDLEIGIMRESICWYCRTLRLNNKLYPVSRRQCKVTRYPDVITWTSNPDLVPPSSQLILF